VTVAKSEIKRLSALNPSVKALSERLAKLEEVVSASRALFRAIGSEWADGGEVHTWPEYTALKWALERLDKVDEPNPCPLPSDHKNK
jgi:hypothetical protein